MEAVLSELSDGLLTLGLEERLRIPPTTPPLAVFFFRIPSPAFLFGFGLEDLLARSGLFSIRTFRSMSMLFLGDFILIIFMGLFSRSTFLPRLGDLDFSIFGLEVASGEEFADDALSMFLDSICSRSCLGEAVSGGGGEGKSSGEDCFASSFGELESDLLSSADLGDLHELESLDCE